MDSTSGQFEPASGAWASIPGKQCWPQGTVSHVRAARAPEPVGKSEGKPSYGRNPGSRRKKYKGKELLRILQKPVRIIVIKLFLITRMIFWRSPKIHLKNSLFTRQKQRKRISLPMSWTKGLVVHIRSLIQLLLSLQKNLDRVKSCGVIGENLTRNNGRDGKGDAQMLIRSFFAKVMAETGQIKLYGDHPTITETVLARARRSMFKEERLHAERMRLEQIGPMAYYSEWVKAQNRDTSCEAVQKHYEETGEDENTQLITMFQHQTAEEYRIMMGTDIRIKRVPLAMRMREVQIKESKVQF